MEILNMSACYRVAKHARAKLKQSCFMVPVAMFVIVCFTAVAQGQDLTGVYLTKADFINGVLSCPSNKKGDWLKVDFNKNIVIQRGDSVKRFNHHQVYGYFAEGYKHIGWGSRRKLFSNSGYYKVLDTAGLIVLHTRVQNNKVAYDRYVYCRTIDGDKKLLTLRNLSKDFAHHPSFIKTIKSINRPYRLHRIVDGMTLVNRIYLEMVKPAEDRWPKTIVRSGKPLNEKANGNGVSSRQIALASFYYQWYSNK